MPPLWTRLVLTFLCLATRVSAQDGALTVRRGEGAQACPDAAALTAELAKLRAAAPEGGPYLVDFTREGADVSAAIRIGPEQRSVRVLRAPGESCAALAEATAVALALVLDSQAALRPAPPAPPPEATPVPAPAPRVDPPAPARASRERALALGAGVLVGTVRAVMPALELEGALRGARLGLRTGLLSGLPGRVELGPGELRSWLVSGSARGCVAAHRSALSRFELCSGALAGVSGARARGYPRDGRRVRPWVAVPVELTVARRTGRFAVEVGAAALVPLVRHDFSIEGLGPAHRSWPVALQLLARGAWPGR